MAKKIEGLNGYVKDIDGKDWREPTGEVRQTPQGPEVVTASLLIKESLGKIVFRYGAGDPLKALNLAQKIYAIGDRAIVDDTDVEAMSAAVAASNWIPGIKGQLLQLLGRASEVDINDPDLVGKKEEEKGE